MSNEQQSPESTSVRRPRVVVGLGNPGERYRHTRHNVGFRVVEELARRRGVLIDVEECRSKVFKHVLELDGSEHSGLEQAGGEIELWGVLPQTFMNRSGFAVRCLRERFDLEVDDFLIVYDEVHLGLGTLRLRPKGSPGGHRGMESIAESLGTDRVARLRLGVGAEEPLDGADLVDFVLGEIAADEQEAAEAMIRRAADACETWCRSGPEPAMQKWNGPPPVDGDRPSAARSGRDESGLT